MYEGQVVSGPSCDERCSGCRLKDAMLNQVSYQESFKLTLTGFILV